MCPSLTLLSSVRACLMPCAGYDTTVSADSFRIVLPQQHTKRYRVSSHVFPCCSNVGDVNRTCDPASRVRCCSVVNALTVQTWSVHVHTSPSPLRTYASSRMQIYTSDGCPAMPHKYTHSPRTVHTDGKRRTTLLEASDSDRHEPVARYERQPARRFTRGCVTADLIGPLAICFLRMRCSGCMPLRGPSLRTQTEDCMQPKVPNPNPACYSEGRACARRLNFGLYTTSLIAALLIACAQLTLRHKPRG